MSKKAGLVRRFLLLMLWSALLLDGVRVPPMARADGGAPNLAYVAGAGSGIAVIDVAQRRVIRTIAVAGDPQTVLLSGDGRFLYVTQPTLGQLSVIAARTGYPICAAHLPGHPTLLALGTDAPVLYVAGSEGTISAIEPTTCAVQRSFQTHDQISGFAVIGVFSGNAFSNQLWVAGTTTLRLFDERGQLQGLIPIAGGPQALCIPSELTAYVTTRQGTVVAVDVGTRHVSPPLLTGGPFGLMDYDALTLEIYVPDTQAHHLAVLAPVIVGAILTPQEPARTIRLDGAPQAVAITSDGQLGFVAMAGGKVAMLDLPGQQLVTTLAVGGSPHFLITGLYPPAGSDSPASPATPSALPPLFSLIVGALSLIALLLLLVLLLPWRPWRSAREDKKHETRLIKKLAIVVFSGRYTSFSVKAESLGAIRWPRVRTACSICSGEIS